MELALLVYLISLLGKASTLIVALLLIGVLAAIGYRIATIDCYNDPETKLLYAKISNRWLGVVLALALVGVSLPSEKTAYTMVAAYAAQSIAKDPKVQQLSGKVLKIVEDKLDEFTSSPK